jgi:hypothetical protein
VNEKYQAILDHPHHVSKTRPRMPMADRAAQFLPFAALTGYDAAIRETGRLTDQKIEMDEETLTLLDEKFQLLKDALSAEPEISLLYFKPDERKAGGAYLTAAGRIRKIDEFERMIVMRDGTKIPMDDVLDMTGSIFSALE